MKEYVIELDQDEVNAMAIASWYIGGLQSTSRVVFSEIDDSNTVFCRYTNIRRYVYRDAVFPSELTFHEKVS